MNRYLTEKEINLIRRFFSDQPVNKVWVYGSYARGEARFRSDLDLLIELDYSQHIGLQFVHMKLGLEKSLRKMVDIVTARALSRYVKPFVEREKHLLYERQHG